MRFRTSWLARLLRGRRLDRNPLRRGSDRVETVVLGALLAAFLAAAPFAAHAAGAAVGTRPDRLRVGVRLRRRGPLAGPRRACKDR